MTGDNLDIKQFDTKMGRKEIRIVRCFVRERQSSTELERRIGLEEIVDIVRRCRIRCHGHEQREKTRQNAASARRS